MNNTMLIYRKFSTLIKLSSDRKCWVLKSILQTSLSFFLNPLPDPQPSTRFCIATFLSYSHILRLASYIFTHICIATVLPDLLFELLKNTHLAHWHLTCPAKVLPHLLIQLLRKDYLAHWHLVSSAKVLPHFFTQLPRSTCLEDWLFVCLATAIILHLLVQLSRTLLGILAVPVFGYFSQLLSFLSCSEILIWHIGASSLWRSSRLNRLAQDQQAHLSIWSVCQCSHLTTSHKINNHISASGVFARALSLLLPTYLSQAQRVQISTWSVRRGSHSITLQKLVKYTSALALSATLSPYHLTKQHLFITSSKYSGWYLKHFSRCHSLPQLLGRTRSSTYRQEQHTTFFPLFLVENRLFTYHPPPPTTFPNLLWKAMYRCCQLLQQSLIQTLS